MDPPKGSSGTGHIEDVNGGERYTIPHYPPPFYSYFEKNLRVFILFYLFREQIHPVTPPPPLPVQHNATLPPEYSKFAWESSI